MENLTDKVVLYYQENKYNELISIIEPIINDIKDFNILFYYGKSLIIEKNELGINYLIKALDFSPNNIDILQEITLFYINNENYIEANKYINKLLFLDKNNVTTIYLKRNLENLQIKSQINNLISNNKNNNIINLFNSKINLLKSIGIYNEYSDLFEDKIEFWEYFFISKKIDNDCAKNLIDYSLLVFDDKTLEESLLIISYLETKDFDKKDNLYLVKAELFAHIIGDVKTALNIYRDLLNKSEENNIIFECLKNLLFFYYCDNYSKDEYISYLNKFNELHKNNNIYTKFLNKNNKKIRIGYLSQDFREHPIYYFLSLIYLNHNKEEFEIFSYNIGDKKDVKTNFYIENSDSWKDLADLENKEIADIIYNDNLDILVDISTFTEKNRIEIMSYKPAPTQISMIGFCITTSLDTVDYKILDNYLSENISEYFIEKIINIPDTMYCYKADDNLPDIKELPYLKNGYLTFSSFNHGSKINEQTIKFWSKILNEYPDSKMIIKCQHTQYSLFRERVLKYFNKYNIKSNRIKFYNQIESSYSHLELYNDIDISLDTYPYNGVTTTFESLIMGVPVLTFTSEICSSRAGKSILSTLGLNDWIINELEKYINIDLSNLEYLRKNLRKDLISSILYDHKAFTLKLENIYKNIKKAI